MRVTINGDAREIADGTSVAALVEDLGRSPKGMAVAINEAVVPRSTWSDVSLRPDDRVEVLIASQGG